MVAAVSSLLLNQGCIWTLHWWFTVDVAYLNGDLELKQIYVLPVAPVQCQIVPWLEETNTTQHCLRWRTILLIISLIRRSSSFWSLAYTASDQKLEPGKACIYCKRSKTGTGGGLRTRILIITSIHFGWWNMYPEAHIIFTHPAGVQKAVILLKIVSYICRKNA